jgi:HK97 family phage major capsid protein
MDPIEKLYQQIAQIHGDMTALEAAVSAENRSMTAEELKTMTDKQAQFDLLTAEVAQREKSAANAALLAKAQPRLTATVPTAQVGGFGQSATQAPQPGTSTVTGGTPVAHNFSNHGFVKGSGEFFLAVRNSAIYGKRDDRLNVSNVSTWAGETVGADGGFALPPAFVTGIMSLVTAEDSFIRALNPFPTQSDIITVPKDEDAPWSTTAVTAAKTAEGTAITASKPSIGQLKVPMYGVKSLVHVDEKSLRDMAFLSAYVERKMAEKIRWKVENYVMNGTGENEPLGIINAPGLLALSDVNSTATVIGGEDIIAMEALSLMGAGGFWIVHPTALPQVRTLKSGTGGYPLYTTDFKQAVGGGLLGYPLYKSFASPALNTTGDILFVKPDGYFLAFEAAGPQNATTIAFAFDQNLQSFRSTLYMGGAPTLAATVTLPDGSTKVSNLIAIAGSRS